VRVSERRATNAFVVVAWGRLFSLADALELALVV
jgi:hypothetical protein|tara:strand:+ start:402 stop:503 length:102 start_codon:yes stop_codon:yes gene_type:complete